MYPEQSILILYILLMLSKLMLLMLLLLLVMLLLQRLQLLVVVFLPSNPRIKNSQIRKLKMDFRGILTLINLPIMFKFMN